jgi:hypothetical protein
VGQAVIVSGTLTGTGSITGYAPGPKTYYIKSTNGSTTFVLSATKDGTALTTTVGTVTGLTFTNPNAFDVAQGDQFIWRKSTSDGSVTPQDADYDTALSGGNMAYSSATGLAAEDILVDGDGFVTPTSSPATEEVVPGQVVDAVAIKVYDKFSSGSANIKVDSYIADGTQTEFNITQQPNSRTAVIVKFTEGIKDEITGQLNFSSTIATLTDDYTVDYRNRKVIQV